MIKSIQLRIVGHYCVEKNANQLDFGYFRQIILYFDFSIYMNSY